MEQSQRDTKYCKTCGYILDHLPENRCPECGSDFDLEDPATFRTADMPVGDQYLKPALLAVGLFFGSFFVSFLIASTTGAYSDFAAAISILSLLSLLVGYALGIFVLFAAGITLYTTRRIPGSRESLIWSFAIGLFLVFCCPAGMLLLAFA